MLGNPRSILSKCVTCLISLIVISNLNSSQSALFWSALLQNSAIWDNLSEEIIPVQSVPKFIDLVPSISADSCVCRWFQVVEIIWAFIIIVCVKKRLCHEIKVVHNFREWLWDIYFPISGTISNYEALKIKLSLCLLNSNKKIVLMNLPSKVRHVNSSITFTWDVEVIICPLWETCIEVSKCGKGINRLCHIIMNTIVWIVTHWITNTCRAFNIENISSFIPGIRIVLDKILSIINDKWSMFLEESEKWRAARASVEPNNNWIVLRIIEWCNKDVMESLGGAGC